MTCIVAVKAKDGRVVIGGDSAGVANLDVTMRTDTKVFSVGRFLIGFTTSFRMGQILRFKLKAANQKVLQTDYEYMCTTFIDAVRKCLKNGGYAKTESDQEEGGTFIVVYRNNIYKVDSDYQVGVESMPYSSCGCGESYALGALKILHDIGEIDNDPRAACEAALSAAVEFSGGVRPPFNIFTTKRK